MKEKNNKKPYKIILLIFLIIFIMLVGLLIITLTPTYTKYDIKSEEIEIWFRGQKAIITDKNEIEKITKLINNGKDGTELISSKYDKGLNKEAIYNLIEDASVKFNDNVTVYLYNVADSKYKVYGHIKNDDFKHPEHITLSDEISEEIKQFFQNYFKKQEEK